MSQLETVPLKPTQEDEEASAQLLSSDNQLALSKVIEGTQVCYLGESTEPFLLQLAEKIGPKGRLVLVDPSEMRIKKSQERFRDHTNVTFAYSKLERLSLSSESIDFLVSKTVLEHSPKPQDLFDEMLRVLRPGGCLLSSELDQSHKNHYPLAQHLSEQLEELTDRLSAKKLWDPNIGRKLYSFYRESNQIDEIESFLFPFQLVQGGVDEDELKSWTLRLKKVQDWVERGQLELSFDLDSFQSEFFAFFENPDRFSYIPLICVSGRKAT